MRTRERLTAIQRFITQEICAGRQMKAPADRYDVTKVVYQEPKCYIAWAPMRDEYEPIGIDPLNVCPGIVVMPAQSNAKLVEQQRFDQYNSIHRSQEMGQTLSVQILFSVYEPGIRLPGFMDDAENGQINPRNMLDGTQEGLFTLTDWMDDLMQAFLRERIVPGSDLFVSQADMTYSLYDDSSGVTDKRPLYYGFLTATFYGYAQEGLNTTMDALLR